MRSRLRVMVTQKRLLSLERLKKKEMLTMMKKAKTLTMMKKAKKVKKRHVSLMRSKLIVVSSLS